MKRKVLLSVSILIAVILLLVVFSGPLTTLLGIEPICIQGNFPDLQVVPCLESTDTQPTITPFPLPTVVDQAPVPLIFDDDGSPDGLVALLYFISHPAFDVKAVTVSCGEAHPDVFAVHLSHFLADLGRGDIPIGAGQATPLQGKNTFPEPWRQLSDRFWEIPLSISNNPAKPQLAAELIVETLLNSDQPMLVFVSGTHTNLAQALRIEPKIGEHVRAVYIMGGSIYAPGNIESDWPEIHNRVAEWNIWVDPLAAREVFTAGLPLHIVPLDATNQVLWTKADGNSWATSASSTSGPARDLLHWMLDAWSTESAYIWDLVAAVIATDDRLCPSIPLALDVQVKPGPEQGQTVVVEGPPNAQVCLKPDIDQIKARVIQIINE